MKNKYEIRGDIAAIIIDSPKYGRMETLISVNKLKKALSVPNSWRLQWNRKTDSFYAVSNLPFIRKTGDPRTSILLHRIVTDCPQNKVVDHINHDTLDNTDINLRISTNSQNMQNKKGAQKNSKSGIRGVYFDKARSKWCAEIGFDGKILHVGRFSDIKDAEQAAIEARAKYMPYSQEAAIKRDVI